MLRVPSKTTAAWGLSGDWLGLVEDRPTTVHDHRRLNLLGLVGTGRRPSQTVSKTVHTTVRPMLSTTITTTCRLGLSGLVGARFWGMWRWWVPVVRDDVG